jgi:hypothetical protein
MPKKATRIIIDQNQISSEDREGLHFLQHKQLIRLLSELYAIQDSV